MSPATSTGTANIANSRLRNATASSAPKTNRTRADEPQEGHPEQRLDVATLCLDEARARERRCEGEEERRDAGERRAQAAPAHEPDDEEHRGGEIGGDERCTQRGDRGPADPVERHRPPRFHGEHVRLPVEEQRKRAFLAQVFGHQADDGLVGVEVRLLVDGEDETAKNDQRADDDHRHRELAPCGHAETVPERAKSHDDIQVMKDMKAMQSSTMEALRDRHTSDEAFQFDLS